MRHHRFLVESFLSLLRAHQSNFLEGFKDTERCMVIRPGQQLFLKLYKKFLLRRAILQVHHLNQQELRWEETCSKCIKAVAQMLALPFSIICHEKCLLGRPHLNTCISLVMDDLHVFEHELHHFSSQKPRRRLKVRDVTTAPFRYYFANGILTERKNRFLGSGESS